MTANSAQLYEQALARFEDRLHHAIKEEHSEPNAMSIATCDLAGRPTARTVLMKEFTKQGLVFFTNENSVKGRQIAQNPRACAVFHWRSLQEQVIVEGAVTNLPDEASDDYWRTRTRESQVSAWASHQSEPLESHDELLERVAAAKDRFRDQNVPRPDHWHGYRITPERIEFWRAGWSRLNQRESYELTPEGWVLRMLNP